VIAMLAFDPGPGRVRRARFVPRTRLALETACEVANGLRDALGSVLGEGCAVAIGEPVALDPAAWRALTAQALAFAVPGRATDVVFVLPRRDARALIAAAFGEPPAPHDASWSALEAGAVERIIGRAVPACDALCGQRSGPIRAVDPALLAPCVDVFDVRVTAPIRLTIGVGVLRALPDAPPTRTLSRDALGSVPLEVRATLGRGTLDARRLLDLRVGDLVCLRTKVAGEGELNVAGQRIALGTCGVRHGRAAFDVRSAKMRGDAP
jgi:hypothetical protein